MRRTARPEGLVDDDDFVATWVTMMMCLLSEPSRPSD
jgi:hypothetical protein